MTVRKRSKSVRPSRGLMTSTAPAEAFSRDALAEAPAERLLSMLAGACAIGFGALAFILQVANDPRIEWLGLRGVTASVMTLVVALVFGFLMLVGSTQVHRRPRDWSILIVAFAVVLLALGGLGGAIAGILGLFAGGVVFLREAKVTG